jgi:hypothetical protein
MGPICRSKFCYIQPIIFIYLFRYIKRIGSTICLRTPPSRRVPQDFSIRTRHSRFDAKRLADESPITARQSILSDMQTADSDWDIYVGGSVAKVLGA